MNAPKDSASIAYGVLDTVEGHPRLSFELSLPFPITRIWQAVSTPEELAQFFPGAAPWTPFTGEELDLGGMRMKVIEVTEPTYLAWNFAGSLQSFELSEQGHGNSILIFRHVLGDEPIAQTATGWHCYLSRLEPFLNGTPLEEMQAHRNWAHLHEQYASKFGVDPQPGRDWAKQYLPFL